MIAGWPNGTLMSDDPFSGETNGIPNGLRVPTRGLAGILLPSDPGCEFGACGPPIGPDDFGLGWRSNIHLTDTNKWRQFANQLGSCLHQTLAANLSNLGHDEKKIAAISVTTGTAVAIGAAIEFPPVAPAAPELGIAVAASTEVTFGTARVGFWQIQNVASTIGCTVFTAGNVF